MEIWKIHSALKAIELKEIKDKEFIIWTELIIRKII